jgi:multicomponent Na+:H+ antiporter subunit C
MGLTAAALVGLGLMGLILQREVLRKVVSLNIVGSGIFLLFGVIARRGAVGDLSSDPVPQAMIITGIVVAFAGTALAVSLGRRLIELDGGSELPDEEPALWLETEPPARKPPGAEQ